MVERYRLRKTGQDWHSCDPDIGDFVHRISELVGRSLAGNLTGTILHGSLATGAFHRPKSDIDLLVVSRHALTDRQRLDLWAGLLELSDRRPLLGDIELSVIRSDVATAPRHPMGCELQFHDDLKAAIRAGTIQHDAAAVDEDLSAHAMFARRRGISLVGAAPDVLLGEVAWRDYLAAIEADFDWIVDSENIVETPFYGVLNACRFLWIVTAGEGCIPDKEEGGLWGIDHLPVDHRPLIARALEVYRAADPLPAQTAAARRQGGIAWSRAELLSFRDFARAKAATLCLRVTDPYQHGYDAE